MVSFYLKTDVAVSAPYGGKDRGGAVFIYFGTKDGIESSFRQASEPFLYLHVHYHINLLLNFSLKPFFVWGTPI